MEGVTAKELIQAIGLVKQLLNMKVIKNYPVFHDLLERLLKEMFSECGWVMYDELKRREELEREFGIPVKPSRGKGGHS